ncbi:MAG: hypothetical protein K9N09_12060 [Candidatus Cloacimonetes bacterium]|nr:hypothetical protein [Candidatus Cloacimonadota bacterium]MCF7815283.1 hypothetical protein [Candidatus Cloacimonadota bacterium]MCF7869418.1 hypothetical protein [Candidatus Cloacimonadota bacterium]MCF7884812.1 hypothetical protein [Candidatus Cloacimonadota bacterium]
MFQTLSNKIITGVITLSMMLLSSYEGNNAKFDNVFASFVGSQIFVSAQLIDAFENDFEEVFKSGQRIEIFFNIKIFSEDLQIHDAEFRHAVLFDPLGKYYTVYLEEQQMQTTASNYEELKEIISNVEYSYNSVKYDGGHILLSAYLKKIKLQSMQKEYDMMMLWKFKKPKVNTPCLKQEFETDFQ